MNLPRFTLGLALAAAAPVAAQAPALEFDPLQGQIIAFQNGNHAAIGSLRSDRLRAQPLNFTAGLTATVDQCTVSGPDVAAFSAVPAQAFQFNGPSARAELGLSCTSGPTERTAQLNCVETIGSTPPIARSWNLNCPACAVSFAGDLRAPPPAGQFGIVVASGTQTGRLNRNLPASRCSAPKPTPSLFTSTGARRFHQYILSTNVILPQCVTASLRGNQSLFMVAYRDGFAPTQLERNYLADPGSSTTTAQMSFILEANQTVVIVVHEVFPDTASTTPLSYELGVSACMQPPFDPVVRNLNDAGPGSLRATLANDPGPAVVSFAPGLEGIVALQSTLDMSNAIVVGPGADGLELRRVGGGSVPVLRVPAGVNAVISDIAISGGQAGGLVNAGSLLGVGLHIRDNAGRGVRNDAGANLTLRSTTISGNSDGSGAGLLNNGTARVVNSTLTGNGVTIGIGGTVVNSAGATLDLYNVTIAENFTVGAPNAAIVNAGSLNLYNSVLANAANVALLNNSGTLIAFNNLSIDASLPSGNSNLLSSATGLLPLALNGGNTPSYLPGPSSRLINAGRTEALGPLYGSQPYLDQRGMPRVQGSAIDIGAVEDNDLLFRNGFET